MYQRVSSPARAAGAASTAAFDLACRPAPGRDADPMLVIPRRFFVLSPVLLSVVLLSVVWTAPDPASAGVGSGHGDHHRGTALPASGPTRTDLESLDWAWPVSGFRLVHRYLAPPHRYGPGHRGIDLAVFGQPEVRSPAAGIVAFAGRVVDRDLVTIDHGNGLVTTLEPVTASVAEGQRVERGQPVGAIAAGGHAPAGAVHFGVRRDGEYINPMLLLGGVPRAILLPCCD